MRKATIEKFIGPDSKAQFLGFASDEQKGKIREDHPIMNKTFNFFFLYSKKDIYYDKRFANIIHIFFFYPQTLPT